MNPEIAAICEQFKWVVDLNEEMKILVRPVDKKELFDLLVKFESKVLTQLPRLQNKPLKTLKFAKILLLFLTKVRKAAGTLFVEEDSHVFSAMGLLASHYLNVYIIGNANKYSQKLMADELLSFLRLFFNDDTTMIIDTILVSDLAKGPFEEGTACTIVLKTIVKDWKRYTNDVWDFVKFLCICKLLYGPRHKKLVLVTLNQINRRPAGFAEILKSKFNIKIKTHGDVDNPDEVDLPPLLDRLPCHVILDMAREHLSINMVDDDEDDDDENEDPESVDSDICASCEEFAYESVPAANESESESSESEVEEEVEAPTVMEEEHSEQTKEEPSTAESVETESESEPELEAEEDTLIMIKEDHSEQTKEERTTVSSAEPESVETESESELEEELLTSTVMGEEHHEQTEDGRSTLAIPWNEPESVESEFEVEMNASTVMEEAAEAYFNLISDDKTDDIPASQNDEMLDLNDELPASNEEIPAWNDEAPGCTDEMRSFNDYTPMERSIGTKRTLEMPRSFVGVKQRTISAPPPNTGMWMVSTQPSNRSQPGPPMQQSLYIQTQNPSKFIEVNGQRLQLVPSKRLNQEAAPYRPPMVTSTPSEDDDDCQVIAEFKPGEGEDVAEPPADDEIEGEEEMEEADEDFRMESD